MPAPPTGLRDRLAVVTGAAGFIGGHLVTALADAGADVVAVDRREAVAAVPGVEHHVADLVSPPPAVLDRLARADVVFHLAAFPGVRAAGPDATRRRRLDNVEAAAAVLAAVPLGTRLVVTSSSSVYGGALAEAGGGVRPSREDDPLRPLGAYARSKVEVELRCAARARSGGDVVVARPFTVLGEGQRGDMAVHRWLAAAEAGRPLPVIGGLHRARDVTDVHDVVRGLCELAVRPVTGAVNLGTGRPRTLGELVGAVAAVVGVPVRPVVAPAGPEEPAVTRADTRRCEELLGFVPVTDLVGVVRRQHEAAIAGPGQALRSRPNFAR